MSELPPGTVTIADLYREAFRWKITGIAVAAGAAAGLLSGAAAHLH